jgi:hypothetical protein
MVKNNTANLYDYLGMDAPGCDGVPGSLESACVLGLKQVNANAF